MYKVISKKVGDSPKQGEKSAKSEVTQKKSSKASDFLKPGQPNLFHDGGQPVVQEKKKLVDIENGALDAQAIEKSNRDSHIRHMIAGGKIADVEKFIKRSQEEYVAEARLQATNSTNNELEKIANKKKITKEDEEKIAQLKINDTGLPDDLRSGVESLSGLSMNDVKVHFNSSRPAKLHALAYTQGTDIHVAPGQEKHLPHEAWHVVQQKQHRVKPTVEINDVSVNDDTALEHEADVMGAKAALQGKAESAGALYPTANAAVESNVQRKACLKCIK